jgi:DNA repair protein RecN (Recombination protein N)
LGELQAQRRQRAERLDYLAFLLDECDRLDPQPDEEPRVEAEWRRLANAEDLRATAARLYGVLTEDEPSVEGMLSIAQASLRELARLDPDAGAAISDRAAALQTEIADLAESVRDYGEAIDATPARRAGLEDRLEGLRKLRKRFGCDPTELPDRVAEARAEFAALNDSETTLDAAREAEERARQARDDAAAEVGKARRKAAGPFVKAVQKKLASLDMARARVDIALEPLPEPGPHGAETVALRAETNPGEGIHPLEAIASGGELSRLLLAIKTVSVGSDPVLTTIFDEVDTGIGGAAAMAVGSLLRGASEAGRQVICVSHLPQIAAAADSHWHVFKDVHKGRTYTRIRPLDGSERLEILSRMLGGDASDAGVTHAEDLLTRARA